MGPSMSRSVFYPVLIAGCLALCLTSQLLLPGPVGAQTEGFQGWRPDRDTDPHTGVKVKVESGPNGVDLKMSVQRTAPGRGEGGERFPPQTMEAPVATDSARLAPPALQAPVATDRPRPAPPPDH